MENITTDLIEEAKNGNFSALEKVLKIAEKEICCFLYYLTKGENDADDIIQEILVKISKKIKSLKNPSNFKNWIMKITLRQYYDFLRKHKKEQNRHVEIGENTDFKDKKRTPMDNCISCEIIDSVKKSVLKLEEPYRLALLMREFEGLSYEEIANLTNSNVGTVKSRISRARHKLKDEIRQYME